MQLLNSKMHSMNAYNSQQFRTKLFQSELQYSVDRKKKEQLEHRILSIDSETKRTFVITCQENFNQVFIEINPTRYTNILYDIVFFFSIWSTQHYMVGISKSKICNTVIGHCFFQAYDMWGINQLQSSRGLHCYLMKIFQN